jgi:transposase
MKPLPTELRRRVVEAYRAGRSGSYRETAELFGIGDATVSRLLRRFRETGDVLKRPTGGNRPRVVNLNWLRKHAKRHPDARLSDRVEAWELHSGQRVRVSTLFYAMRAIGWSFKKKRQWHESKISSESKGSVKLSKQRNRI